MTKFSEAASIEKQLLSLILGELPSDDFNENSSDGEGVSFEDDPCPGCHLGAKCILRI